MNSRPLANVKNENVTFFTFDMIGRAIESLADMLYEHKFCKHPFINLNLEKTQYVLGETVKTGFILEN